ncbi:MAG: hypothetical protein AAB252_05030 [Pseudomonadota bacterium]
MRPWVVSFLWFLATVGTSASATVGDGGIAAPVLPPANDKKNPDKLLPVTASRGKLLYENHCQGCHTSQLHIREQRRVRSIDELRGWVARWATTQQLRWGDEEIGDVTKYLNQRYYRLVPPARKN